ncbi:MAG: peptide chain release factor N(5)-glutamine methyltransferase [Armatimonadota bacterium]
MTVREALQAGQERLARAGVESPRLDASLLVAHVLQRDRTFLLGHPEESLAPDQALELEELLRRREAREPLPYLLGSWEFLGLRFRVGPGVLIPRPETEVLVETVAARLSGRVRVLDVGAGSGCIGIGLATLLPEAEVVLLEAAAQASELAWENAAIHDVTDRVAVVTGAFPEAAALLGQFDAVVSNPPYIPSEEVDRLAPELVRYEPRLALDGGADGLDVLRALATVSPSLLHPGGLLALEVMAGQAEQVADLLRAANAWTEPEQIHDLAGIPRVVLAKAKG